MVRQAKYEGHINQLQIQYMANVRAVQGIPPNDRSIIVAKTRFLYQVARASAIYDLYQAAIHINLVKIMALAEDTAGKQEIIAFSEEQERLAEKVYDASMARATSLLHLRIGSKHEVPDL